MDVLKELSMNRKTRFYYSPFSLFKALGRVSKLEYDPYIVTQGLSVIIDEFKQAMLTPTGTLRHSISKKGFKDPLDFPLYEATTTNNL